MRLRWPAGSGVLKAALKDFPISERRTLPCEIATIASAMNVCSPLQAPPRSVAAIESRYNWLQLASSPRLGSVRAAGELAAWMHPAKIYDVVLGSVVLRDTSKGMQQENVGKNNKQ